MNPRRSASAPLLTLLVFGLVLQSLSAASSVKAQPTRATLTLVAADGGLWANPDVGPPASIRPNLAQGGRITYLAWHPSRPEVLMVRQRMLTERQVHPEAPGDEPAPFDTLLRLDLATGTEQVLLENVGPQARLVAPRYGPDGSWAYVRLECCLAFHVVFFEGGQPRNVPANSFLPPAVQEVTTAAAGPAAPDGRIVFAVNCCQGDLAGEDPSGLYLAGRDLKSAQRLTRGSPPEVIGIGPAGAWVAGLREGEADANGRPERSLVLVNLADGTERILLRPSDLGIGDQGDVAPDGRIAVASLRQEGPAFPPTFNDILTIDPTSGARNELTNGAFTGIHAFAWGPTEVVRGATPPRVAIEPDCGRALTSTGTRWDDFPMEPFTWGYEIKDLGFFDGRPAFVCLASGPPDRLPMQNRIGCVLIEVDVARTTDEKLMCGAFLSIERPGSASLLWIAHNSAATAAATGFRWNNGRFELSLPTYETCYSFPLRPLGPSETCQPQ